ncbi:hypothetical protein MSG28_003055 [Choristoneura fumiferana]|uniref:Uncharacterized protein n=1 Tax=Choristoneura fumiferana TaxID=7141 RepID=A0ACC0JKH3_CHOFU|nr:hypothetical protein MSG28_003055 [Choristoneura fumiferana]
MSLSNSRHQFLAFESQNAEDIQYERKGGIFVTTCVCIFYIICAVVVAALVGIIVYFITYFKVSQKPPEDIWDESEPFGYTGPPSPDLRLPSDVVPSFYRLKLKTDLDKSIFKGEVYITIRANKNVKEITLHSKGLSISQDAKLTEQIYEAVETLHRSKRQAEVASEATPVGPENVATSNTTDTPTAVTDATIPVANSSVAPESNLPQSSNTTESPPVLSNATVTNKTVPISDTPLNDAPTNLPELTTESTIFNNTEYTVTPVDTQVTHSAARNIEILSIAQGSGDRLIITLASALKTDVDYTLELTFEGNISDAMMGFYKSTYTTSDQQVRSLGVTQFEPTSARAAFPCFDEPAFKAMFEISIAHLANLTALSNMKVSSQEDIIDSPGWKWTHFERSVNMSTYLVAYIVSDFASAETTYVSKDNITKPIRIWARPELISKIEPEWNMFESFSIEKMDLLRSDALKNTSPVSRKVIDASEISQKFDVISYTKGANLIRMLNHTLSEELFHKGLLIYLNDWKYKNAEENDLWTAMSKATQSDPNLGGLSAVDFMNSWTRQAGYPVVNLYRHGRAAGALVGRAESLAQGTLYCYYRVNYDEKNWELLSTALKAGYFKSPITKAQLIDDAFNLAKSAQLNYSQALGLTTCVIDGEDSKIVWDLLFNNMGFLKYNIRKTSGYVYFQDYMKIILQKQLERLNYGLSQPKDYNEAFLVENLVMWECEVESERLLEKSLNDLPNQYAASVWSVEPSVGARIAQDFLIANFDAFKAFAHQHKEKLVPMSQTLQKIVDTATLRIRRTANRRNATANKRCAYG